MIEVEILRSDVPTRSGRFYPKNECKKIVDAINKKQYPVLDNIVVENDSFSGKTVGRTESAEYRDNAVIAKLSIPEHIEYDYFAPAGSGKVSSMWSSDIKVTDYELHCIQVGRND